MPALIKPTPEQQAAIKDHALYLQMLQEGMIGAPKQSQETILALQRQDVEIRLAELEKQSEEQRTNLDVLRGERDKALRWGIIALGTAVMGMGSWIVNLFTGGHIR